MSCTRFAFVFFSSMLLWPLATQADQPRIPNGRAAGQSGIASTDPVTSKDPVASSAFILPSAPTAPQSNPSATPSIPETSSQSTSETVTVHVETILATNSEEPVDDRLPDIRRRLGAFRYSSYQLVQEKSQLVNWGKKTSFTLPGGRFLQVVARAYPNERIGLQLMFLEGDTPTPLMSTTLNIRNRGKLYIGGRAYQGGMLILRIGATTESPR
jgi:hypothetical protein